MVSYQKGGKTKKTQKGQFMNLFQLIRYLNLQFLWLNDKAYDLFFLALDKFYCRGYNIQFS